MLQLQAAVFQSPCYRVEQLFPFKGLRQVVESAVAHGGESYGNVVHRRHNHHGYVGVLLRGALQQSDAVKIVQRHHQVVKHEIECVSG